MDPGASSDDRLHDYEYREYRPGDEHAILETFRHVFRGQRAESRSLAEWRWEFEENPDGWRIWLALLGGRVVAQSAGLGHRTLVHGREVLFSQTVDSMVLPEHACGLKNPGVFVRTVHEYVRAYGGTPDLVFYGWPNPAALRIGKAHLGYETIRREAFLVREPTPAPTGWPEGVAYLRSFDAEADRLWRRCAAQWPVSLVHDARFLDWRFRRRPLRDYDLLGLREKDELRGMCVLRAGRWPLPGTTVLAEWMVPDNEPEAGEQLLAAAAVRARDLNAPILVALLPPWSAWAERLRRSGFRPMRSNLVLTVRVHGPEVDLATLRDGWWVQLADSDLV